MCKFIRSLAGNPAFQLWGAKAALHVAPRLRFKKTAIFSRWQDVRDILDRDLDFLIAPVNAERIGRVNGPFVLGMDRGATHLRERDALYKALRQCDLPRIGALAGEEAQKRLAAVEKDGVIDVVNGYARPVAAESAAALMGIAGPSPEERMRVARALFHECFLNLGNDAAVREKAVAAFADLKIWVEEEIAARRKSKKKKGADDMIARMIESGEADDDLIRRTVSGMFVGAIDTTATCVAQIVGQALSRPALLRGMMQDLDDPQRMRGWCWEALRFHPHNPVVLRHAARDTAVSGTKIEKGDTVVCLTLAAMHDPAVFSRPGEADPQRPPEHYLHFGGGMHPCAGRAVNGVQIPLLVARLLARAPAAAGKTVSDGPFPDHMPVRLQA